VPTADLVKHGTQACAGCGCNVPQKVGVAGRVRRRCDDCNPKRLRKATAVFCKSCGGLVQQTAGKGRAQLYCSKSCRRSRDRKRDSNRLVRCQRCGETFAGYKGKRFCSSRCRRDPSVADDRRCLNCKSLFRPKKKTQTFCSRACRHEHEPMRFKCLNCERPFRKKKFKSGSYSCATKYCSRECAFEARRLKKKCARRSFDIARSLATWFLSWGDDSRPSKKSCVGCGVDRRWTKDSPEPPDFCPKCERQRAGRKCRTCSVLMTWSATRRVCNHCRDEKKRKSKRKSKNRYGRNHKQRTRRRGAPYTPIRNTAIYERDNWECQICCRPLDRAWRRLKRGDTPSPRARTVDHVIPLAQGKDSPGHVWHNLIACCHECNSAKCDKDPTGWHCTLPRSPDPFALP
jgi:HNH endonuclease